MMRMTNGSKEKLVACRPYTVRMLGRNMNDVALGDLDVAPIDVHEAPTRDDVDYVVALVGVHRERGAWLHADKVAADAGAVAFMRAHAFLALDADKLDTGIVVQGPPLASTRMMKVPRSFHGGKLRESWGEGQSSVSAPQRSLCISASCGEAKTGSSSGAERRRSSRDRASQTTRRCASVSTRLKSNPCTISTRSASTGGVMPFPMAQTSPYSALAAPSVAPWVATPVVLAAAAARLERAVVPGADLAAAPKAPAAKAAQTVPVPLAQ